MGREIVDYAPAVYDVLPDRTGRHIQFHIVNNLKRVDTNLEIIKYINVNSINIKINI